MTREQQKQLKILKQYLPKVVQNNIKSYGFKKKDNMVWYKKNEMYFSLLVGIRERDGHCYCFSQETIKPLWLDDLFWDIMDMAENKSQPLSLRCIGAFAIRGMVNFQDEQKLLEWSADELEKYVAAHVEHFSYTVKNSDIESYYSLFDSTAYQGHIQEILVLLHKCEYQKALEKIQTIKDRGQFCNKGIWFKEYAEIYCKKCMQDG